MYGIEYQDLTGQVYQAIRDMILAGELVPGQKLIQDELAERLGVSRTPLLTAFSKLEHDLLLESKPRRGMFVKTFRPEELVKVYDVRLRLEPLGAGDATEHATESEIAELREQCARFSSLAETEDPTARAEDYRFHMRVMEMSRNDLLFNIIASYNIIVIANFYGFLKDPRVSAVEHQNIVDAIAARDRQHAMRHMFVHVNNSRLHLLRHLEAGGAVAPEGAPVVDRH
jgi:DNA-binding GntR family transcriptional regulator